MAAHSMSPDEARECLALIAKYDGNVMKCAREEGLARETLNSRKRRAEQILANASRLGDAPGHFENGVAPGYLMGKVTVQRNAEGAVERTWERQSPDNREENIMAMLDERIERVEPRYNVSLPQSLGPDAMLNQVTIADGHVGALAWDVETGSGNWDIDIAKSTLLAGAFWLMDNLPPANTLLLNILGDFLDSDGYAPLTPASKHLLDVDGRFPRIADTGSDIIEECVMHALGRYAKVILCIMPGNHDPLSAWWMRKLFRRVFKDNPRVTVEGSIRNYWAMLHGKTMVCAHHGDKAPHERIPGIFAADFAEMWGQSNFRVCHTGHWHFTKMMSSNGQERPGMMILQHPTLNARNAWAAEKGLVAARQLAGHSYHVNGAMPTTLYFTPTLLG